MGKIKEWLKELLDTLNGPKTATPAPARPAAKVKPREPYVFVTVKGKKYHWDRLCPCLRNSNEIKMDISKARKAGYTACDKCCPAGFLRRD